MKAFPGQHPNEKVIMMLRRHWLIFARYVLQLIGFNLLPIVFFVIFYYIVNWEIPTAGPLYVVIVMAVSLYYLGAWLAYFHSFVDYRLDMWILTDQRIINIEQQGLFDRVSAELNLNKVQDVTAEVHGHTQTFFDYGNVYIQTAAEQQRFIFQNVPHPEAVARVVIQANDAIVKREPAHVSTAAA